jgi:glycosyltransferase involved in cell wall biosynthesis
MMQKVAMSPSERFPILLFYREFEQDKLFRYDRYLKRIVRPFYNLTHHRQKKTGFAVSFELLVRALRTQGWTVRINDRAYARRNPSYPVGLVGFPILLDGWDLPNPAILGPSLYDHPMLAPDLMKDPRFRSYLVLGQWTYDMFQPVYGDTCVRWHAGIDLQEWSDARSHRKDIDFLIYDKVRWDYEKYAAQLIEPICRELEARGSRFEIIRYKRHDHETYRTLLQRARSMIFLCEHETQGLAYQEALASNVPVVAWDNGYWLDPLWQSVSADKIPASSVPFFSDQCGERFRTVDEFGSSLDRFLERLPSLRPRDYVVAYLSTEESARIYANAYFSLLDDPTDASVRRVGQAKSHSSPPPPAGAMA